jgi:hypothetical protein
MASPLNITKIPAPRVAIIDPNTGLISREWYRFLLNLFDLTGAGTNAVSLDELQIGPPNVTIDQINQNINKDKFVDLAPQYQDLSGLIKNLFYEAQLGYQRQEIGTIAPQNAENVSITGGRIDGTPIGDTTTSSGKFTTLNATGGIGGGTF